jgi:hypothetical protein
MKVNKTNRNYLMLLYWGDESDTRNFDILCDGVLVGSESLCHNDPGRFIMRQYPIPEEATSGKESVQIHITSPTGTKTGGIYYAYMMSSGDNGTGIKVTGAEQFDVNNYIYDLLGRQLTAAQKGINIIGGKKVAY